jgi:hypothetical protein
MRLPVGTRVRFQQWFAPGAHTGYLVIMQLERNRRPAPQPPGLRSRGIGLWSFPTARFDEVQARATRRGVCLLREPVELESPGFGQIRTMVLATPDGFPVEVFQC